MAKGTKIYLFEGPRSEVRLVTFICSDVLEVPPSDLDACYEDALILHIQLNDAPRSAIYSAYKRRLFRARCDRTELICLNWASGIEFYIQGQADSAKKKNIAGSAWHSRSEQLDTNDATVEHNQKQGLYYTRDEIEKRHVLHFSYEPAAFLLTATKVKHSAVVAGQSYRRGPKITKVFAWKLKVSEWTQRESELNDGFQDYCTTYGGEIPQLARAHEHSALAAERIVAITSGLFSPVKKWYAANMLWTARIDANEVVYRVTVTQDPDGHERRNQLISQAQSLADLASDIPFKAPLSDLADGFRFAWAQSDPCCNVISTKNDGKPATLVFAGTGRSASDLAAIHAKTAELASSGSQPDRFSVIYQEGRNVKVFSPNNANRIDANTRPSQKDFTEPQN
jgi:hypothetical protein